MSIHLNEARRSLTGKERPNAYSDIHLTPAPVAAEILAYFSPSGRILEPCAGKGGNGGFVQSGIFTDTCEIEDGRDFFDWHTPVDWIITNPPFSIITQFMNHSLELADNVVFAPIKPDKLWSKLRMSLVRYHGHALKEIVLLETPPPPWPQTGFQYIAVHWQRGWKGDCKVTSLMDDTKRFAKLDRRKNERKSV